MKTGLEAKMYFESFPYTLYSLDDRASVQLTKYILVRFALSKELKENFSLYDEYDIRDGESPEILADFFYNQPTLHWIILHVNEIVDPRFEWPLGTYDLIKYTEGKYTNINAAHHYEDEDGYIVNSTEAGAVPVSNYQYEERLNEEKRRIKILKPQFVQDFISEFQRQVLENTDG